MIHVDILFEKETIAYFEVKGHALSNPSGSDLVCASVSGIMYGIINALDTKGSQYTIKVNEDPACISIKQTVFDETSQLICEVALISLQMILEQYPQNIQITYRRKKP